MLFLLQRLPPRLLVAMKVSRLFLVLVGTFLIPLAAHATTLVVTNTNDNLAGSLRQMIQDAGAGDTIVFNIPTSDPGYNATTHIYAIGLVSGELLIDKNLTIDGGTNRIKLQRISGTFRIVHITTGSVSLLNLTISNGLFNGSPGGGGINNGGSLTLRNCTLNSNSASFTGGAIYNVATGIATLVNSTFQGNTSAFSGQVITNDGDLTLNSCTLAANSTSSPTVQNNGVAHVRNSIIAGAGSNGYDVGGAFVSDGCNFIGIQDPMHGSGFGLSGSHDQVGAVGSPANPQLGALVDNGGPTKTMAPSLASPVVDQGNSGLTTDQRGLLRPVDQTAVANAGGGDASDIGAFELGILQGGPTFTVNTIDEHSDGNCEAQDCTLWDAVNAADNNVNNDSVIQFAPNLTGTITTLLQSSGMNVLRPMTINGPGARRLTISGSNQGRVFNVANTATVVISGLTIANGKFTGNGGAIINAGNLTLQDCTLSNSQAVSNNGGGIYSTSAATLNNCTVVGNSAASLGGGVDCELGTVNVTNCTFVGNQSASGAGLTSRGTTTIRSSTFAGNLASTSGSQDGGGVLLINATADIMNTIIANNTGAIWPDLAQSGGSLTADYDLIRDGTGWNPGAQGVHNIVGQDPQFAAAGLTNNGGFTDTVALQSTSPAINAGNNAIAPSRDQRHYSRSGTADIG
ncbi:MAG: choice-of-anchor Q domain-containing protein, partial [Chthoniobacterales bacterium]